MSELSYICNKKLDNKYKPRLISFISSFVDSNQMNNLTMMIDGHAYRMIQLNSNTSTSSRTIFKEVDVELNSQFLDLIENFIQSFLSYLKINFSNDLKCNLISLAQHIRNTILKEKLIHQYQKRLCTAHLLLEIIDSIEVLNLLGVLKACDHLKSFISKQIYQNNFNHMWKKSEIFKMTELNVSLKSFNSNKNSSLKYDALLDLLYKTRDKKTIICVRNKTVANILFQALNCDRNLSHFSPRFASYLSNNNNSIYQQFEFGPCRLLIICFRIEFSLSTDQVVVFDDMWSEPFIPLDSQCDRIVICSPGQRDAYNEVNERKHQTAQMIDYQIRNRVEMNSIEKIKSLINRKTFDANCIRVKFSIECYITENEVARFNKKIKSLEKYHIRINSTHESYASAIELFPHLKPFNITIKTQLQNEYDEDRIEMMFNFARDLVKDLSNCLSHLLMKNLLRNEFYSAVFVADSMELGNLVSPVLFAANKEANTFNTIESVKVKFELSEKTISIITAKEIKFDIRFDAIDQIICCDDRLDHFFVYIPLKRYPHIYKDNNADDIVELLFIDEMIIQRYIFNLENF